MWNPYYSQDFVSWLSRMLLLTVLQRGRGSTREWAGSACLSCIIMEGVQANRNGARSRCQSPTRNAVRKIVWRKVRWTAVVEMVSACSSAEYRDEEEADSWTVMVHVCTSCFGRHWLIYIQRIYCVLVKGARISKWARCFILLLETVSSILQAHSGLLFIVNSTCS